MKLFIFVFFVLISFSGCYTIVWDPLTMDFPQKDNSINKTTYYDDINYYGDYYEYYNIPWWYRITPPSTFRLATPVPNNENQSVEALRQNGGRINRDEGGSTILLPSRNSGGNSSTSSQDKNKEQSGNSVSESGSNNTKRESSKNSDGRQIRNESEKTSEPKRR